MFVRYFYFYSYLITIYVLFLINTHIIGIRVLFWSESGVHPLIAALLLINPLETFEKAFVQREHSMCRPSKTPYIAEYGKGGL